MGHSKADFKARRETLGLTQQDVARQAGVTITSAKRWERPGFPDAPADVWAWLDDRERVQAEIVDMATSAVMARGGGPIQMTYYRTQDQYDEFGREPCPYGVANANARLVATRLRSLRIVVDFSYPDDDENIYHRWESE